MDPWVLPSHHEPKVPLSAVEVAYQAIVNTIVDPILVSPIVSEESEESYVLAWTENSLYIIDYLDMVFPSEEAILEDEIRSVNIFTIDPIFFQS